MTEKQEAKVRVDEWMMLNQLSPGLINTQNPVDHTPLLETIPQ